MSNNEIIKTQTDDTTALEYLVAGSVVLFFGLLYWLLNQGSFLAGNTFKPQTASFASSSALVPTAAVSDLSLEQPSLLSATENQPDSRTGANSNADPDNNNDSNTANTLLSATTPTATVSSAVPAAGDTSKLKADLATQQAAFDKLRTDTLQQQQAQLTQLRAQATTEQQTALDKLRKDLTAQQQAAIEKLRRELSPQPTIVETPTPVRTVENLQPQIESTFAQNLANMANSEQHNPSLLFDQVNFAPGSAELDTTAKQQIQVLADFMNQYPSKNILIRGHTDNTGDTNINSLLSLARSSTMKTALADLGIASQRIKIEGVGSLEPIAPNNTEEGRSKNRRIELIISE